MTQQQKQGAEQAWALAQAICTQDSRIGMQRKDRRTVFGYNGSSAQIIGNLDYWTAKKKFEAWEDRQQQISYGEVVRDSQGRYGVVVEVYGGKARVTYAKEQITREVCVETLTPLRIFKDLKVDEVTTEDIPGQTTLNFLRTSAATASVSRAVTNGRQTWISVTECARSIGVSRSVVYRKISSGEIRYIDD